jgi:pyruvate dehydrogenase E1 component beta subunit
MSAGLVNVPIVFRGPNGAAAGVAAQHSQCFGAWYSHCPGLKVVNNSLFNCGSIIITASLPGGDVIGCSSLFRGRCQRFAESCNS